MARFDKAAELEGSTSICLMKINEFIFVTQFSLNSKLKANLNGCLKGAYVGREMQVCAFYMKIGVCVTV